MQSYNSNHIMIVVDVREGIYFQKCLGIGSSCFGFVYREDVADGSFQTLIAEQWIIGSDAISARHVS